MAGIIWGRYHIKKQTCFQFTLSRWFDDNKRVGRCQKVCSIEDLIGWIVAKKFIKVQILNILNVLSIVSSSLVLVLRQSNYLLLFIFPSLYTICTSFIQTHSSTLRQYNIARFLKLNRRKIMLISSINDERFIAHIYDI